MKQLITLKRFQLNAIIKWSEVKQGVIIAPTGSGKTLMGLAAVEYYMPKDSVNKILIVVPTINLAKQWKNVIEKEFETVVSKSIYMIGDGSSMTENETSIENDTSNYVFVISVINSIRFRSLKFNMCILDEFHRYFSRCNYSFLPISQFTWLLGLTATLKPEKLKEWPFFKNLPIVVEITHKQVFEEGLICNFFIRNVPIQFTYEQKQEYEELSKQIKQKLSLFNYNFGIMQSSAQRGDVNGILGCRAVVGRKQLLFNSQSRLPFVKKVSDLHLDRKIIIFTETIENCNDMANLLKMNNNRDVLIFHSEMKKEEKNDIIKNFGEKENSILCCVRALDEGLNVPDASIGIIASGSSTRRQFIQRLGRIIRGLPGKTAYLYQLYFENTKDEAWAKERSEGIESVVYNM
jgi:superfamily II DNA or RNA helicase